VLTYLEEGTNTLNPGTDLYVVNNSFVNQRVEGGTFVYVSPVGPTPALIENNIFFGPGTLTSQSSAVLMTNFVGDPLFVNLGEFDYHLTASSPAIDAGAVPERANGFSLRPAYEYVHLACGERRLVVGSIDIGAYEFGGAGKALICR
jgi:hypothetical protein